MTETSSCYVTLATLLRYEQVPGQADPYPHIYGPLNLDAVIETRPLQAPSP